MKPRDLPDTIAVFPLRGVILLPRSTLPFNVFEPRYLQMVDEVIAGSRLIGIVQPAMEEGEGESPEGKEFAVGFVDGDLRGQRVGPLTDYNPAAFIYRGVDPRLYG